MEFVKVAKKSEINIGCSKRVLVGNEEVALWRIDDRIFAIRNVCPHQHHASLHQGSLEGATVTCPMHGWKFSLETGEVLEGEGKTKVFQVQMKGDDIYVERPVEGW